MKKPRLPKLKKKQVTTEEPPSRITNETVAEHREKVLAGGRRFKYPHQIARHKLVINTVLISLVTIVILVVFGWWQLYIVQNTGDFFYRVTRIVPVSVASVDGKSVRFSDYLMTLKGSKHYLEQTEKVNLSDEDGKRQLEFIKSQALNDAIADSYAAKLAKERNITITDKEVDAVIDASLNTVSGKISEEVYNNSTLSTLGYTPDEYRHIIRQSLIRQAVSYDIDDKARSIKTAAEKILKKKPSTSLSSLANQLKDKGYSVEVGSPGLVPKTNHDGGLSQTALGLKTSEISKFIRSTTGDGYYLVQLVSKNSTQVNYNFLRIPLTEFDLQLTQLKKNNQIKTHITVEDTTEIKRQ